MRQWVLSLPLALRLLLAAPPELVTPMLQAVQRMVTRQLLGRAGLKADKGHGGAGELKIIAAILERPVIEKILTHLGLQPQPQPSAPAHEAGQDFAT